MPTPPLAQEEVSRRVTAYKQAVSEGYAPIGEPAGVFRRSAAQVAAERLGIQAKAILYTMKTNPQAANDQGPITPERTFTVPPLPSADVPLEELIARRRAYSERIKVASEAREMIPVHIHTPGPVGLLIVGDPHIDNDGSDFAELERHLSLARARQKYLFACGIGDLQDAWPGRLARLYAKSSTSVSDAWRLVEWMMRYVPWLFLVKGNHDCFVGDNDPLDWIMRDSGGVYEAHGVRLALNHPNGAVTRVHARHDFKGHSMYNGLHGHVRELREGFRDHLLVAGHRHFGEEAAIVNPEGTVSQLVRVSGYKIVDDYAKAHGYKAKPIHKSALVLLDPDKPDNSRERVWLAPSIEEGAEYLDWRRARYDGRARVTVKVQPHRA